MARYEAGSKQLGMVGYCVMLKACQDRNDVLSNFW